MAFDLTQTTKNLSQELPIRPVLILEIDGISLTFGTDTIQVKWTFDSGEDFDSGLFFDGLTDLDTSRAYIQQKGTTNTLTSQTFIEEGGASSIQKFVVNMVDKDGEVSRILTPGVEVADPLSRDANIFLNFVGGSHPEDSVRIFTGLIDSLRPGAGNVSVSIAHPDQLKRQEIFQQNAANIDGAIDDSVTTITLTNQTKDFIEETTEFKTYVVIEDEIIQYTGVSGDDLTGCVRGSLNTTAAAHDDDSDVLSFYTLSGAPIETSLKIMMSGRDDEMASGDIVAFEQLTATLFVENAILIEDKFFADNNGIEGGELITITGSINPANDVTDVEIVDVSVIPAGTVFVLDATLTTETSSTASFTIKSQYNVLPDGLGMKHSQVDIAQNDELNEQFGNQFPEYEIYIKDTINGRDFLTEEIYKPAGLYSLIRKGRSSIQMTKAPTGATVKLDENNVLNPGDIIPERTVNKYFYNNITYKYNADSLTDKFLTGNIALSARSSNQITAGNTVLSIGSLGLRDNAATTQFITRQSRRFLERFQFAAERIKVKSNFETGFNIEVGDTVSFGSPALQVYDSTSGTREFKPRSMEVTNRSFNIFNANVTLELLDTQFSSDARYGSVSPNSFLDAGSTTTSLKVKKSFTTGVFDVERDKWEGFIGETIRVRDENFTFAENVTLLSFDPQDDTRINISPALSLAPSEDYLVDLPSYNEGNDLMKTIHTFATPQVDIVSGTSGTVFEVGAGDIAKFFVGGFIRVHNEDFSVDSTPTLAQDDLEITDITVNTITVDRDMGFTPTTSEVVSLIGFSSDDGVPYRFQ